MRKLSIAVVLYFVVFLSAQCGFCQGQTLIAPEDIFPETKIASFSPAERVKWLPLAKNYVSAHAGDPIDPRLVPSFRGILKMALAPKWCEAIEEESPGYVKHTHGSKPVQELCFFYTSFARDNLAFDVKGFYRYVVIFIKDLRARAQDAETRRFFEEIAKIGSASAEKGLPEVGREGAFRMVREISSLLLNRSLLPDSPEKWSHILGNARVDDGWLEITIRIEEGKDEAFFPGKTFGWFVSISTKNGKMTEIFVASDWHESYPELVKADTRPDIRPLNPDEIEYVDQNRVLDEKWQEVADGMGGVFHEIETRLKRVPEGSEIVQSHSPRLPLTPVKWRICEYATLVRNFWYLAGSCRYTRDISRVMQERTAYARGLAEWAQRCSSSRKVLEWFAGIRVPPEAERIHRQILDGYRLYVEEMEAKYKEVKKHVVELRTVFPERALIWKDDDEKQAWKTVEDSFWEFWKEYYTPLTKK